jgi:RNA polymerase sigma factor (sigma-70 family)
MNQTFRKYLNREFRKNVYNARLTKNPYQRASVVNENIICLYERFKQEYPEGDFIKWMQKTCFKLPQGKRGTRIVPIYDYAVKYLTTGKGESTCFNHEFYNITTENRYKFMDGNKDFVQTYFLNDNSEVSIFDNGISATASPEDMLIEIEDTCYVNLDAETEVVISKDVFKALQRLKPFQLEVIVGHYFQNLSLRDIACNVGKSEQYVGKVHRQALDKLKDSLKGLSDR